MTASAIINPAVPVPVALANGGTGAASAAGARASLDTLYRNLLYNGDFRIAQRGVGPFTAATVPLNSDGNYILDGWVLLSDGNDIVDVSRSTTAPPTGAYCSLYSQVETANKKFAWFTMLEALDSAALIGTVCSLQFKVKTTTAKVINKLRCAILSWASTADSPTKDVVATWGASGANITPAANWTIENTPADLALTTAWQTFKIENVAIDTASAANVGVLIWVDDTDCAADDELYLADVQLEEGAACTRFERLPMQMALARCQRYYQRIQGNAAQLVSVGSGFANGTGNCEAFWPFVVSMRIAPVISTNSSADLYCYQSVGGFTQNGAISAGGAGTYSNASASFRIPVGGVMTTGYGMLVYLVNAAAAYIAATAELGV